MIKPLAKVIQSQSLISGFWFHSSSHIINLFADDVVLILTNPLISLPATHQVLTGFSSLSYYKVNFSKFLILDLGVHKLTRQLIVANMPFSWADKGIPYLGTVLTSIAKLAEANYNPLIEDIGKELQLFAKFELSWAGRIATYKMIILPKILYIFHTLPIPVKSVYFHTLNSLLRSFVWQCRRARCSRVHLIHHRKIGVVGLVDLWVYYLAINLAHIRHWFQSPHTSPWVEIEEALVGTRVLHLLLLMD